MSNHKILNQLGKTLDGDVRRQVEFMLHNGMNYSYIDNKRVEVIKDHRHLGGSRDTVVKIEGIDK